MIKKIALLFFSLFASIWLFAQQGDSVEMADTMRQNGKIYVVVAVILTILAGIFLYLIRLDRKISKLEKENRENQFITKKQSHVS
ncbi:MAG: CcmD family protein [Flavisolibacter sp.]